MIASRNTFGASFLTATAFTVLLPLCHTPAVAEPQVGVAAAINTTTFGTPPGGARNVMVLGENVIYRHRIETSGSGLVQVLLKDGSTFTVGPNADLVIDEFVYDPNAGTGTLVASLGKGVARFVGGKLSKNRGGVSVKTPVGTIGIRGGIANLALAGPGGGPSTFSFIFGDELTFTDPSGRTTRAYAPGYTIEVSSGGSASRVRRTEPGDLGQVQAFLTGAPGQQGGIGRPPTDLVIERSGVPDVNSRLPRFVTTPLPKPFVVQSTAPRDIHRHLLPPEVPTREGIDGQIRRDSDASDVLRFNLRTPGSTFTAGYDASVVVTAPGAQGLIGGPGGQSGGVNLEKGTVTGGTAVGVVQGAVGDNWLVQFVFEGSGRYFYTQGLSADNVASQTVDQEAVPTPPAPDTGADPFATFARGIQYFDYDESFLAFAHYFSTGGSPTSYDPENVVIGVTGVATDFSAFGAASDPLQLRTYDLATDPTLQFSLGTENGDGSYDPLNSAALFMNPIVAAQFGAGFLENVVGINLYLAETSSTTLAGAHALASSFLISGTGASQKSFASLLVGTIESSNGKLTLETGRRGSHRLNATDSSARYSGAITLLDNGDGASIFGSDANYMVLGTDLTDGDSFQDLYADPGQAVDETSLLSGTMHVAELLGKTNLASLNRGATTNFEGYAAGVLESTFNLSDGYGPTAFASTSADDFSLTFLPDESTMSATLDVSDSGTNVAETDVFIDRLHLQFGVGTDDAGENRGTFIDTDTYGAREASLAQDSYILTESEDVLTKSSSTGLKSYLVASTVVGAGDAALFSGSTECTCDFLEWGYWGTNLTVDGNQSTDLGNGTERVNVHMGTWVAGDVIDASEFPTTGGATYAGHAVGNVISGSGSTASQYLAAGDFSMTVDFANRTGSAAITSFDGRDFTASMSDWGSTQNRIAGALQNVSLGTVGDLTTSLVRGPLSPTQGVVGNFHIEDSGWSAVGIVAGQQ